MEHKGCPSCDGHGVLHRIRDEDGGDDFWINCWKCKMSTAFFRTPDKAWAAWDQRAEASTSRLERFTLDLAKSVVSAGYWTLPAEKAAGEILDLAKALIAAIDEEEK